MKRIGQLVCLLLVGASVVLSGIALAGPGTSINIPAFAALGPGNSKPDKPGKGCGDKNHYHERKDECKKHDCEVELALDYADFAAQQASDLAGFEAQQRQARAALVAKQASDLKAFEKRQNASAAAFKSSAEKAKHDHDAHHEKKKKECDDL